MPEDSAPTKRDLDEFLRELRRLSSARRAPEPPASSMTRSKRHVLNHREVRALRRANVGVRAKRSP